MGRSTRGSGRARILIAGAALGIAVACTSGDLALGDSSAPWEAPIAKVDEALGRKEFSAALRVANEAYRMALGSRSWEGMVAVGDAYRRIGEATGLRQSFDAKMREVYLKALFRARQQASVDGVLRVAEGFAALGDAETVRQCLRIADRLAVRNPDAQADVRAFSTRLGDPALTVHQLPR